ncbi:glycosyltransferase family 39 protein [soil metagenome]
MVPLTPWVALPAVSVVAVLLAYAGRYGFHRDELYFIESMRHPAWGYIDNPSLTPAIGWVSRQLFGDSLVGLRVLPALEVGVLVVVVAVLARELGADRFAQRLAAVLAATSSFFLAIGHLLTTPTLDVLITALVLLGLVRIVRTGEQRWWLAVGLAVGLGLENKYTLALVLVAVAVAALITGAWRRLVSWWMVAGTLVALSVWAPQLWWQIDHGWPQFEFARAIAGDEGGENRATLVPFQLLIVGPPLVPIVLAGLWSLWSRPAWRSVRFVALGYVVLLAALLVTGGKGYYSAGLFPVVIAAGAIATNDWTDRGRRPVARQWIVGVAILVNFAIGAVITLPILPASSVDGPIGAANEDALETIGWPDFVAQVAAAVPAADRDDVVILVEDYGMAGAIDRFGPSFGLPRAYSGHNSYADFGTPPGSAGPVLVVGHVLAVASWWIENCQLVGTVDTIEGIENDVDGEPIFLCASPAEPWERLWPLLSRYG